MKIKQKVIDRTLSDEVTIAKIAKEVNKSTQTIKKWLKENSLMVTLFGVYSTIQKEYSLSDKEMFDR